MSLPPASRQRRLVYLVVLIILSVPILTGYTMKPARMKKAENFFEVVETLPVPPRAVGAADGPGDQAAGGLALIALDFGPNTTAENEVQAEVTIEHLFRRRIPVALFSQYAQAEGFLNSIPERIAKRLNAELDVEQNTRGAARKGEKGTPTYPGSAERWEYGRDWVNLGYRFGQSTFLQALAKSENLPEYLGRDVFGARLEEIPCFKNIRTLKQISFLGEFTGLVGMFDSYMQFFQHSGYVPKIGHGCTSITIPEAYIYLDSGQLTGLLEGIAGAAWYSELLRAKYPTRNVDDAIARNTALGVGHLLIIALIVIGNLVMLNGLSAQRRRPV